MKNRFGLVASGLLVMSLVTECFSSEVLKLDGIGSSGVRSFGKTHFAPLDSSELFEIDRTIAPRTQAAEDEADATPDGDELPEIGAESFNLKLLSQQKLTLESDAAKLEPKQIERPKALKKRVLVFKASWCGACQSLNYEWPKLEAVKWKIGPNEQSHFQLVDADERPDLMSKYGVSSLPTVILIENEQEVSRQGSLGAFDLAELYYGRLK